MKALWIKNLISGGIITNYHCSSKCAHCLYRSGPGREKGYITGRDAEQYMRIAKGLGCAGVHIGGGEPLLQPDKVVRVLEAADRAGVLIEYVETNSSWYRDRDSAGDILSSLRRAGLTTLLVSISPFHNEYIPFYKVKGVLEACRATRIHVFPWISDFLSELSQLDDRKAHSLAEFERTFGNGYLKRIMQKYWVHPGGRALDLMNNLGPLKSSGQILQENPGHCYRELFNTSHFHIDLFGGYIPGLCSGLSISVHDLGAPLSFQAYPIIHMLAIDGIKELFREATEKYEFMARDSGYVNKCDLCTDIRHHLAGLPEVNLNELSPQGFYGVN